MTFFFGLHLILGGKLDVKDVKTFFFYCGLLLILGGKLDVERREDPYFCSSPMFSVEKETGNCAPHPFQISGHAPASVMNFINGT